MFFPKLLDGGDGQSRNIFFLLIGQVRHAIQYVQPGIHFAYELQHFFRQFAIAGKAEVYERVIQRTLEDRSPCHCRAGGAGPLCDRSSVQDNRLFGRNRDEFQFRIFGYTDLQPFHSVV